MLAIPPEEIDRIELDFKLWLARVRRLERELRLLGKVIQAMPEEHGDHYDQGRIGPLQGDNPNRVYSNEPWPLYAQGFLKADEAAMLVGPALELTKQLIELKVGPSAEDALATFRRVYRGLAEEYAALTGRRLP